jgi:hypothetical protein
VKVTGVRLPPVPITCLSADTDRRTAISEWVEKKPANP